MKTFIFNLLLLLSLSFWFSVSPDLEAPWDSIVSVASMATFLTVLDMKIRYAFDKSQIEKLN